MNRSIEGEWRFVLNCFVEMNECRPRQLHLQKMQQQQLQCGPRSDGTATTVKASLLYVICENHPITQES